jgi:hypothetical protein
MAAHALDDTAWTLECMVHEMPNPISRWDSHQTSSGRTDAPKPESVATHPPYTHHQRRAQGKMSNRRQPIAPQFQPLDDSSTTPSTTTTADDDDSCDEEIISRGVIAYSQDQEFNQVHVSQAAMPFLSNSTEPSMSLLRGSNGEDVQEIGQWYFACQLPETPSTLVPSRTIGSETSGRWAETVSRSSQR